MLRRIDFILLGFAIVLAIILNWESFAHEPLAIDEHVSFWIADESSPSTLLARSFQYSATPPMFFVSQRLSMALLGKHEWTLRLPAAASFLAAILAVWWCGRRWISPLAGGIAAILLAAHPAVLPVAVAGRPYSFGLVLAVLALDAAARLGEAPSKVRWVWLITVNLILVQTHYLFASIWIAELVWLAGALWLGRLSVRHIVWWVLATLMCLLTVTPGIWHVWNLREYLNWTTHRPDLDDVLMLMVPVTRARLQQPLYWVAVAAPIVWQLVSGRYRPRDWLDRDRLRTGRGFITCCVIGLGLPVAALWLLGRFWLASIAADRYLVIFVPIVAITWAGFSSMFRGTVAPLLCLSVLILWSGVADRIGQVAPFAGEWRSESNSPRDVRPSVNAQWKEIAQIIGHHSSEGGLVVVGSGLIEMKLVPVFLDDPIFHDYVSCRLGRLYLPESFRRIGIPMFWPNDLMNDLTGFYRSELAKACRGRLSGNEGTARGVDSSIWLVAATDTDVLADAFGRMRTLLGLSGAVELETWSYEGIQVIQYRCPP